MRVTIYSIWVTVVKLLSILYDIPKSQTLFRQWHQKSGLCHGEEYVFCEVEAKFLNVIWMNLSL